MKKTITTIANLLIITLIFAQTPEKMSYQAVIRNVNGGLVKNQAVGMQISILQGTADGTPVYVESQAPTSNANGLVSIEIGSADATVVSGDFSAIDWANGPYFIKTETDPAGGTSYTISGTSQLLSVPYALHAKTAENIFSGNYSDLSNTPDLTGIAMNTQAIKDTASNIRADIPDVSVYAQKNNVLTLDNTSAFTPNADYEPATKKYVDDRQPTLAIGDSYGGGIIFWLDATGQHGLIAATTDQSTGIRWHNGVNRYTGTTGDGLYAGAMNTAMIIVRQMIDGQSGNFASRVCADYSVTVNGVTYGDWYLPSKYELDLLYQQKAAVGDFANAYYWSSTETFPNEAGLQHFSNGTQISDYKYNICYVRAVRAF